LGLEGRAAPEAEAVKAAPTKTEAKDDLSKTILINVGRIGICSEGSRGGTALLNQSGEFEEIILKTCNTV
jgi:hypothetical protein